MKTLVALCLFILAEVAVYFLITAFGLPFAVRLFFATVGIIAPVVAFIWFIGGPEV